MSSIVDPQPELPAEEDLVAYLDGELPPEGCRRVEARLAADADYRRQLHDLNRAWEALDALPATRGGEEFARTTMEMVAVVAEDDLAQHAERSSTAVRRRTWWLAVAGITAAVAGFASGRLLLSRGDARLLADLPVIRQVDVLRHVADVEFLRRVPTRLPIDQFLLDETAMGEELLNLAWAGAPAPEDRQKWLEALPPEDKAALRSQANRFRALPVQERQRLRQLQRDIGEAGDSVQLQRNLLAYGHWLSRLTLGEQEGLKEKLSGLPLEEQIKRLRHFMRQAHLRESRRLSPEDTERLRRAVIAFAEERKSQFLPELRRRGRADVARRLEEPRGMLMILGRELQNDDSLNLVRERIVKPLSPEAQSHLENLGPWARRLQLWQWARDSLRPDWGPGELERFFAEELDNNQRERLLNLAPGEMQAELQRLYVASEFGFRGMGAAGGGLRNTPLPNRPDFRPEMDKRGRPGGPPRTPPPKDGNFRRRPQGPAPPPPHRPGQDAI